MKNKGLIITLIIILLIIITGLIVFLYLSLSGKLNFQLGFKNLGTKSSNIIFDNSYELDSIDNLEILSTAGNINFKDSTDGKIRVVVYGQNNDELKVSLEENKLKVDYSEYKNVSIGFNFYINDIIIYIPKDYSKEINIDADYGDIEIIDLENATINIKEDCGNVKLGKVKNTSIENSYGNVEIAEILNKFTIESDCGNIKIDKVQITENSYIKSDYGNVKIKETNDIYIDAKTDLGDVNVNTNNRHSEITLKIEGDCGDIKVGD
ncbi:MAG: DUF4097 family beta strand repeat protein [Clostridia bacterium]|nr:DUF4097 family beta strand repeat protein [Clostridia bacterium]